jgi:F0F1-type ATP synthase assembly protein I
VSFDEESERARSMRQIGLLIALPMLLAVAPILGYLGGDWLDGKLGTQPWLGVVGLVIGFVAGARESWLLIKRASAENDDKG